jgi:predicted nucleic acid-binding protein
LIQLLLDSGVWLSSADRHDAHHNAATELIARAAAGELVVAALDLTLYEVANVAVIRWKSSDVAADLVRLVRVACGDALERVDEELCSEAAGVAREHGITVYDAAYVAAARRRGARLVSLDLADLVGPGLAITPEEAVLG